MQALRRSVLVAAAPSSTIPRNPFHKLAAVAISKPHLRALSSSSSSSNRTGEDEWNDAWESAWLPEDLNPTDLAPWETGGNFPTPESASPAVASPPDVDSETKAFVEEMEENWEDRRRSRDERNQEQKQKGSGIGSSSSSLYSLENIKRDYRLKKQRIHAGLWSKEIENVEEAKLGGSAAGGGGDDIDRLLDSCSEIFDSANEDLNDSKNPISSDFKNKPEGWETTSKAQDGNIWDMSQREEDILLQEFDRRIAYSKFQIASFIKTHIFSRRRPIDGWKYMIEELGPNAKRRGKGNVSRLPSLSDPSTQPFKEETAPTKSRHTASRRR